MRWYSHLYVGRKAGKKRYRMIQAVRHGRLQVRSYVITPASNGNNLLDIYPSASLLLPYYRDQDLLILGIAADYWEALEVAGRIVDEMYRATGDLDLQAFIDTNSR